MNRTTTRLATIGGIVLLGAFAIVLAQNDARQRDREQPLIAPPIAQQAVPIPVDALAEPWSPAAQAMASKLVVRGNNDEAPLPTFEQTEASFPPELEANPLRQAYAEETSDEEYAVVPAAAEIPTEPPTIGRPTTASPPAWLPEAGSPTAAAPPANQQAAPLPTLPSFPMASTTGPATPATVGSAASPPSDTTKTQSAALPRLPATFSSDAGNLFDTQRSALPPTNLLAPPSVSSTSPIGGNTFPGNSGGTNPAAPQPMPAASSATMAPTGGWPTPLNTGSASPGNANPAFAMPTPSNPYAATTAPPPTGSTSPAGSPPTTSWPQPSGQASGQPTTRTAALANLVSNQPGNRYLDGSQNPNMLIHMRAPEEIQVGKKATFVISVRNAGNATAHDVRVVDIVPRGSRFIEATPAVTPDAQGLMTWQLGEMAAGDEQTITLQIVPEVQGEVGSRAIVYFAAQASVRTVATLPKLEMQVQSLPEMLIGSRQTLSLVIKNSGTGVAREVRLEVDLPDTIKHDIGESQLAAPIGDLRPNEVRPITLDVTATAPGQASIAFRALNDDGAAAEQSVPVNVLAPQLAATITGPALRYLDRQATFVVQVSNQGTTLATNLEFIAHLPPGMKFVSTTQKGSYDPASHAIRWALYELPVQVAAPIEITLLPVDLGAQSISFAATADLGLKAEAKHTVTVDGLAELAFTIGQDKRTIETGSSSTYWVQVTNVGNKPDKDVQLVVTLPPGSVLKDINAQVKYRAEGNQIFFDPVPEMRNKDQSTFRFEVQHNQPGTQIVRTQLTSVNWPVAVTKEEGTLVYNDQN
jgi:uncharacterized repeat protein (TIGR01451 family)